MGVAVIEDCAHAAGSRYSNLQRVGSVGNLSCFSFQAVKNLPTFDAGMLVSPSEEWDQLARQLSWLGIDSSTYTRSTSRGGELYKWQYDVPQLGWKYNGNDVAATFAMVGLEHLKADNLYRRQIYLWYEKCLDPDRVRLIKQSDQSPHHLLVIRTRRRDETIAALKSNGIAPGVHYLPNYLFPIFKNYVRYSSVADRVIHEILSLPNHLSLTEEHVKAISSVVNSVRLDRGVMAEPPGGA